MLTKIMISKLQVSVFDESNHSIIWNDDVSPLVKHAGVKFD